MAFPDHIVAGRVVAEIVEKGRARDYQDHRRFSNSCFEEKEGAISEIMLLAREKCPRQAFLTVLFR